MSDVTYLYRHYDSRNRLLYVGISLRPLARLDAHRLHSFWFSQIVQVRLEQFSTRGEALKAEKAAIQIERPLFNVIHAPPDEDYDAASERTWNIIVRIEPRLNDILSEALESSECANRTWYGYLKPKLCRFVGHGARDALLKSPQVYDVAYQRIYAALPDCGPHCEGHQ